MAIKKAAKPLTAFGTDLTVPGLPKVNNTTVQGLQTQQDAANSANNLRYGQGLGVLTGGYNTSAGDIEQAIAASNLNGTTAKKQVGVQLQNDLGHTEQDAINRGLGNTTIRNAMLDMDKRRSNDANQAIDEQVSNRLSGLKLQAAQNANQGAGSIAGYIAGRNDVGPDAGMYANLAAQAAANKLSTTKSVSTTVSPEFRAAMAGGMSGSGAGSGIGSSGYSGSTGGGGSSGGASGGGGASYSGGSIANYLGGGGTSAPQVSAPAGVSTSGSSGSTVFMGNGGSVNYKPTADATTVTTPNGVSNGIPANQAGSVSISKTGTQPCIAYNYIFHSGLDPKSPMFCH
jgi:hypothetical protein